MSHRRSLRSLSWLLVPGSLSLLTGCGDNVVNGAGACGAGLLPGDLVITEFLANPAGADNEAGFEWLEVYNTTDSELDLRGLLLSRTEQDTTNAKLHEVSRSWVVPGQSYAVAGALLDDELELVPHIDYGYADGLGDMKNSDGRLVIACDGEVVDEVVYQEPPTDGRSRGFSGAVAPDALVNDDLSQWCDASTPFDADNLGTPGERNDVCLGGTGPISCFDPALGDFREAVAPAPGSLVITEIMTDPAAVDDADGEWFEIYAITSFDLNGVAMGKDPGLDDAEPFALNDCVPVEADTRLVFAHSDDEAVNGGLPQVDALFDFSLNQDNGRVVLSFQGTLLDVLPYGNTGPGVAVNVDPDFRTPELNDELGFSCAAIEPYGNGDLGTPGSPNTDCEVTPPAGQCFDGTTIRYIEPPSAVGDLVITEILQNPEASDEEATGEWFEIRANAAFDLQGLPVGRTDNDDLDPVLTRGGQCTPLTPGDHVVVAKEFDPVLNGGLPQVDGTFGFSVPNSGERGLWAGGTRDAPLDVITWTTSSAGAATSLDPEATDPVSNDDPANFCIATAPYGDGDLGTPGAPNPACGGTPGGTCSDGGADRALVSPGPGDLVITEIMPNPDAVPDADGEWIEILALAPVDLNGLNIGDDPSDGSPARLAPGGACLALTAGERAVVAKTADPMLNGGLMDVIVPEAGSISLGNTGDHTLAVWLGGGEAIDSVAWSGSSAGAAWSIDPDAEDPLDNDDPDNWCLASTPYGAGDLGTPGEQGPACGGGMAGDGMCLDGGVPRAIVLPQPGELVINEWMPNPDVVSDTDGEWFEVYVGADVDLNGLELSRITGGLFVLSATLSSSDCISVASGTHLVFARDVDPGVNGGLPAADVTFGFSLNNSSSGLAVGVEGVHLDEVTWASSTAGAATKVDPGAQTTAGNDDPGNLCPATTPYGPGDNAGTPGAMNPPC